MLQVNFFRMAGDFSVQTEQGWSGPGGWLAFSKDPQWGSWGKIAKRMSLATHDIVLYLQFIFCAFCSDLLETLSILKSIFDVCKESARETAKAKINEALFR